MYKSAFSNTKPTRLSQFLYGFVVLCFMCFTILATTIVTSNTTFAASRPGGNVTDPVVRAVDIAEPAVVRIFTTLGGHLTVHFSATNSVTFPQGIGNSYPIQLSGTGTFISSHGDILTADHVINPPHDQALSQYLDDSAANDVAAYINQNAKQGSQVTPDQVDQELRSGQLPSDPKYDPATSEVFLSTSYTGPLTATSFQDVPDQIHAPVDRIEQQSAFNQKDVAIVHVSMNDMPSVQLGDSSNVQQQDQLTIIGFPGNGDVSTRPTDILTSSVNTINVSSIKTSDSGAEVIQVGGNVEHGDSGGPALDSSGSVVGIVSFGLSDATSPGGTSFLQASNSARDLVNNLKLDTTPGSFQKAWSQAFADYSATFSGHWHKAAQEFAKLAASYPQFKAVSPYLTYTQAQAKNEPITQTNTHPSSSSSVNTVLAYALTIGAIVLVLLLAFLLFRVMLRSNRKKKAAAPENPVTTQASQVPQASQASLQSSPTSIAQQHGNAAGLAPQQVKIPQDEDDLTPFGAPPTRGERPFEPIQSRPVPSQSSVPPSVVSGTLRPWPCGHMNRANARFCSICGEPAPPPPTRHFEQ
jgi:S1-C subfamily serine protease/large-conductance mechanosensitive channel